MLLTIDAGNTNTVFAVFDGGELCGKWRMGTDPHRTSDEYAVWLFQLIERAGLDVGHITSAIIATVVPNALFALKALTERYFGCAALVVGEPGVDLGINVMVDKPAEVGADRLVNAIAAYKRYGGNLIILDFGTATTFDVVDKEGNYAGGVIAPGVNLSLEALHKAAARLPNVEITHPAKVVGTDTVGAMQSGVFYGYLGMIEGIISRINEECGGKTKVIATGGLASLYGEATSLIDHLDNELTIQGLQDIYMLNAVSVQGSEIHLIQKG